MPKVSPKDKQAMQDLYDDIRTNLLILEDPDREDPIQDAKDIVCSFYRKGACPACNGCHQPEWAVIECKDEYMDTITHRPMRKWSENFTQVEVRSKKPLEEAEKSGLGLNCDSCHISDTCPYYKAKSSCSIDWSDGAPSSMTSGLRYLVKLQFSRVQRASVIEATDGGVPDDTLSREMDRLTDLLEALHEAENPTNRFSMTIEETGSGNNSGGILSKLFGGAQQKALPEADEGSYIEIKESDKPEPIPAKPRIGSRGRGNSAD